MDNKCLIKGYSKMDKLDKNIFNRGIFKLLPSSVNKIWRRVFLYDRSNYYKNYYIKNAMNIYKWKDIEIEEINFYNQSIKNITKIMDEFYKNIKKNRENSHKYYSRKLSDKDILKIKHLHLFIIKQIRRKIDNIYLLGKKRNVKSILKESFQNKKEKKNNFNIYLFIIIIAFLILKFK